METANVQEWAANRVKENEIKPFLDGDRDFIAAEGIYERLNRAAEPEARQVEDILAKSLELQTLEMDELALLIRADTPDLNARMAETADRVKSRVYGNRIVVFAPLYLANQCVNACVYCGFRNTNQAIERVVLNQEEIRREGEVLAGTGHRRVTVVLGEHPDTDLDYLIQSLQTLYGVKIRTKTGRTANIRRISVTVPPFNMEELARLKDAEIGAYQVFQETYHRPTYDRLHPRSTPKHDYRWRLYAHHRALASGLQDVGLGALFGLYDWRFEVMGLLAHVRELERRFKTGPHNISVPRLEPALNTPFSDHSRYKLSDAAFKRVLTLLRLAVPYSGLLVTARESAALRNEALELGATQMDASSRCGVGAYANPPQPGEGDKRQQFRLADDRSLPQFIAALLEKGRLPSFCTAGFRCGRTGQCFTERRQFGLEGPFCGLNAVLTFREWVDDFAPAELRAPAAGAIGQEIQRIQDHMPQFYPVFKSVYDRLQNGEGDLYF